MIVFFVLKSVLSDNNIDFYAYQMQNVLVFTVLFSTICHRSLHLKYILETNT